MWVACGCRKKTFHTSCDHSCEVPRRSNRRHHFACLASVCAAKLRQPKPPSYGGADIRVVLQQRALSGSSSRVSLLISVRTSCGTLVNSAAYRILEITKVFHSRYFPKQEILFALIIFAVNAMLFSLLSQSTVGGAVPWCMVIPSTLASVTNWNPSID